MPCRPIREQDAEDHLLLADKRQKLEKTLWREGAQPSQGVFSSSDPGGSFTGSCWFLYQDLETLQPLPGSGRSHQNFEEPSPAVSQGTFGSGCALQTRTGRTSGHIGPHGF